MWDSYQVIRTTFHFSLCPELCTVVSVHLQLRFTFTFYRPIFLMVLVLHSPPLLAQLAFATCSIYSVCKNQEELSLGRCQGRCPNFHPPRSASCGASLPAPATNAIATAERTAQDLSPVARSEALGKICWYVKEPYGPQWDGCYQGAWKTHTSTWLCGAAGARAGLKSPLDGISKPSLCSSAPGCFGKRSLLGRWWVWDPIAVCRVFGQEGNTHPHPHAPAG